MDKERAFTLSEVAQHASKQDCWFVIKGRVLNVTKFMEEHPGGEEVLIESAGKDATKEFEAIGHSKAAKNFLLRYQIGYLQGYKVPKEEDTEVGDEAKTGDPKMAKKMEAFLIKEDPAPNYAAFFEFFVPLLVAFSYFSYRCLTGVK